jgi:hypothetical protein
MLTKKATTHDIGNPGPGLRPAQKCGGVKSVCFVVWWLALCTINSIRNKCKTCVIFFHTLVFVRQNNAMSYNIFSFISNVMCSGLFCVRWVHPRVDRFPSLFKLSFHKTFLLFDRWMDITLNGQNLIKRIWSLKKKSASKVH